MAKKVTKYKVLAPILLVDNKTVAEYGYIVDSNTVNVSDKVDRGFLTEATKEDITKAKKVITSEPKGDITKAKK